MLDIHTQEAMTEINRLSSEWLTQYDDFKGSEDQSWLGRLDDLVTLSRRIRALALSTPKEPS